MFRKMIGVTLLKVNWVDNRDRCITILACRACNFDSMLLLPTKGATGMVTDQVGQLAPDKKLPSARVQSDVYGHELACMWSICRIKGGKQTVDIRIIWYPYLFKNQYGYPYPYSNLMWQWSGYIRIRFLLIFSIRLQIPIRQYPTLSVSVFIQKLFKKLYLFLTTHIINFIIKI